MKSGMISLNITGTLSKSKSSSSSVESIIRESQEKNKNKQILDIIESARSSNIISEKSNDDGGQTTGKHSDFFKGGQFKADNF